MDKKTHKVLTSSRRRDWCTPLRVISILERIGVPILLDPCSNADSLVPAELKIREGDSPDGLEAPWMGLGYGLVYVNPPYGREVGWWTKKAAMEIAFARLSPAAFDRGGGIVMLLPARTETAWFRPVWEADLLFFFHGRLVFHGAKWVAPFPSVLSLHCNGDRQLIQRFADACAADNAGGVLVSRWHGGDSGANLRGADLIETRPPVDPEGYPP